MAGASVDTHELDWFMRINDREGVLVPRKGDKINVLEYNPKTGRTDVKVRKAGVTLRVVEKDHTK